MDLCQCIIFSWDFAVGSIHTLEMIKVNHGSLKKTREELVQKMYNSFLGCQKLPDINNQILEKLYSWTQARSCEATLSIGMVQAWFLLTVMSARDSSLQVMVSLEPLCQNIVTLLEILYKCCFAISEALTGSPCGRHDWVMLIVVPNWAESIPPFPWTLSPPLC